MLKAEKIEVFNFEGAVRGARNPMNSWDKSDSYVEYKGLGEGERVIGPNDMQLLRKLYKAGTEHRKYMRQIFVSMDITAPFYWWKQFDTYKIGTTSNSCSTMHKLTAKPFEMADFSCEHLMGKARVMLEDYIIPQLNEDRELYLETKSKDDWWQMIQLLPESYNQKRTITMNYENAVVMIHQRSHHKLDEWHQLIDQLYTLPYLKEIIGE